MYAVTAVCAVCPCSVCHAADGRVSMRVWMRRRRGHCESASAACASVSDVSRAVCVSLLVLVSCVFVCCVLGCDNSGAGPGHSEPPPWPAAQQTLGQCLPPTRGTTQRPRALRR